uniref:GRANULINS domain-containing protein n=1 Tax=Ascaris lumbricoides TaxID=6252 RepID=A0A0M3I841_ASCLU
MKRINCDSVLPIAGYCYDGQRSQVRCTAQGQCLMPVVVLRHWAVVIGAAYARMPSFAPHRITVVNAPSAEPAAFALRQVKLYEFDVPAMMSVMKYLKGCTAGYKCSANGYCCPSCPSGETPFGSCYNGMCAEGYSCRAGNICCRG